MHKILNFLGDLLFPVRCPVCDRVVPCRDEGICDRCLKSIRYVEPPRCLKCGKHIDEETQEYCSDCEERPHIYKQGRALYYYKDIAKAIYRYKYKGRKAYAKVFGKEMVYYLGDYIKSLKADAIVPVPLYKSKARRRGYNQATLLARILGEELNIPVEEKLVLRNRNTKPLKLLNPEERLNNLKKAFILMENGVKLKRVIIIDDIYTTGSTIDTMADLLMEWGIEEVYFVTLAIGENT